MILRRSNTQQILLTCLSIITLVSAGGKPGYWQPASCPKCESNSTPAQPAVCPAGAPVSCSNIKEPDYCCPKDHFCTWANSKVACCPEGCDCSSWSPTSSWAPAASTWAPAPSSWAPASSKWAPTSSYVAPASSGWTPISTSTMPVPSPCNECQWHPTDWNGYYCSTIYAHGPNLPTTAHAKCGVVLVVNGAETLRQTMGWVKVIAMIFGLQVLGGFALFRR